MQTSLIPVKHFLCRLLLPALLLLSNAASHAQISTNATNSTIRFRIAYGTTLVGNIDVELFDADKPITVSNFLTYAQSGRYSGSILHSLSPGLYLQGGGFTVPSPFTPLAFQSVNVITENAAITNEFSSGIRRSNVFGTLAMAKFANDPNSATSQWFFNLGDNTRGIGVTNLDSANGGYTVFGQVTAGAEILQFFNSRGIGGGILNMQAPVYQQFCSAVTIVPNGGTGYPFAALPVSFTGQGCPNYTDLYNVDVIILSARDVLPPKLAITNPALNASLTNADVTVRGTVSDNVAVAAVRLYLGTNSAIDATFTNGTWTATITNTPPGTNAIRAEAIDTSGLRSQVTSTFFRSVRVPLQLTIDGLGTVTGATNQQRLEIGRGYKLTAKAAPGNLFVGWTGDVLSESAAISFLMTSNSTLNALFATNLFPGVVGNYAGLFGDPVQLELGSAGYVTLKLANSGAYSGKIQMNGKSYPFKGVFSANGQETNTVLRPGASGLLLTLSLDLTNGTDQITGTITNNQVTLIDTNHAWLSYLRADRAAVYAGTNTASQAGRYTALLPADTNSPSGPAGDGFASVSISTKGAVSFTGTLSDGSKATQKAALAKDGSWPVYVSQFKGAGALIGWLTNSSSSDPSGLLNWFHPAQPGTRYFPAGFTNDIFVAGERFIPGSPTTRVFNLTNAVVGFTDGNLVADFADDVTFDANGKATNLDSNKLTLTISKSTGLFTGSVTPPGSTKAIPFKGAILQQQLRGGGFFLGTNQSGRVQVGP